MAAAQSINQSIHLLEKEIRENMALQSNNTICQHAAVFLHIGNYHWYKVKELQSSNDGVPAKILSE